jgi:hypothetical protein
MSRLKRWVIRTWERMQETQDRIATTWRPERILVVHVMKTAGTSLRRMLQEEYGPRRVYPGDPHLNKLPGGCYPPAKALLESFRALPPHNVLVGHFTAAFADQLPLPYRTATFLREPIQRSLSHLVHGSKLLGTTPAKLLDDPAFISSRIADLQTRVFGAESVCDPQEVIAADETMLARAIHRLEKMDFVGLTERFADSCRIFDQRFGTRIAGRTRRENVLRPEGNELTELIPRLEPHLRHDRVLYETAVAKFNADRG